MVHDEHHPHPHPQRPSQAACRLSVMRPSRLPCLFHAASPPSAAASDDCPSPRLGPHSAQEQGFPTHGLRSGGALRWPAAAVACAVRCPDLSRRPAHQTQHAEARASCRGGPRGQARARARPDTPLPPSPPVPACSKRRGPSCVGRVQRRRWGCGLAASCRHAPRAVGKPRAGRHAACYKPADGRRTRRL